MKRSFKKGKSFLNKLSSSSNFGGSSSSSLAVDGNGGQEQASAASTPKEFVSGPSTRQQLIRTNSAI
jgi:hypothetical protein